MKKNILAISLIFNLQIEAVNPKSLNEINLIQPDFILNIEELAIPINQMIIAMDMQEFNGNQSYSVPQQFQETVSQEIVDEFFLNQDLHSKKKDLMKDVVFRKALYLLGKRIKTNLIIEDVNTDTKIVENILLPSELLALRNLENRKKNYNDNTMKHVHAAQYNGIVEDIEKRLKQNFENFKNSYLARIEQPWLRFLVQAVYQDLDNNELGFLDHAPELFNTSNLYD